VPGGIFPNYELPDHTGQLRKLSELQGDDPLILTLARGHYCPKEHQQHLELAAFYPKIAVAYTQIATISTDDHHTLQEFRASVGAQWTFLSDPDRTVQKDLDIQEYTDPEHNPLIPHTLVLKPGFVIYCIYNGYWFWGASIGHRSLARIESKQFDFGAPLSPEVERAVDSVAQLLLQLGR
jgi:peroxiredoxin